MTFVVVDWGTTRVRAHLVRDGASVARREAEAGVSKLEPGEHAGVFRELCGDWLRAEPDAPVALVGMVGSREGWFPAPYAACPAGPEEVAAALVPVDLGAGRAGIVVPGLLCERGPAVDVMRGEETHLLGSGVTDGLVCLPGTHCKWAEMRAGRVRLFATFITGEAHALLREHSMIGRPAAEPADPAGFAAGLADAGEGPLLRVLFEARAATVTGRLRPEALGPYLSGLLTGQEVAGALALFGPADRVTVVADEPRAALYREALARHGTGVETVSPDTTLLRGVERILDARTRLR